MLFLRSFFAAGFLPPLNGFSHGRPPASICLSRYWWFSGLQSSQKYCLGIFFLGMPMHWVCCHALQLSHWIIMRPSSSSFAPHTQRITSSPLAPSSASGDVDLVGCDCDLRFLGRGAGDDGSAWMSDRRLLTPLVERTLRRGSFISLLRVLDGTGARFASRQPRPATRPLCARTTAWRHAAAAFYKLRAPDGAGAGGEQWWCTARGRRRPAFVPVLTEDCHALTTALAQARVRPASGYGADLVDRTGEEQLGGRGWRCGCLKG